MNSEYLNIKEVAEKYRKSEKTIRRWINFGMGGTKLFAKKVGKNYLITPTNLQNFIYKIGA